MTFDSSSFDSSQPGTPRLSNALYLSATPNDIWAICKSPSAGFNAVIEEKSMGFNVGDVVRISEKDLLRGGEFAKVLRVVDSNCQQPIREYVVEFSDPPKRFRNDNRFLCCIYREEQMVGRQNNHES